MADDWYAIQWALKNQHAQVTASNVQANLDAHEAGKTHLGLNAATRCFSSVNQSIPNITDTILNFNSTKFDIDSMHNLSLYDGRLNCNTAGIYQITANVDYDVSATGTRALTLRLNDLVSIADCVVNAATSGYTQMGVTTLYKLNVGDYVDVSAYQSSGASLSVLTLSERSPILSVVRVG